MARNRTIQLRVNGVDHEGTVEVRKTLSDFLREDLGLSGTNIGCEHGVFAADDGSLLTEHNRGVWELARLISMRLGHLPGASAGVRGTAR